MSANTYESCFHRFFRGPLEERTCRPQVFSKQLFELYQLGQREWAGICRTRWGKPLCGRVTVESRYLNTYTIQMQPSLFAHTCRLALSPQIINAPTAVIHPSLEKLL